MSTNEKATKPISIYYHAEKDALAGFYYQAKIKQTFEVVFIRKKTD